MINVAKVKYYEPIYYIPSYSNCAKVSIIKLISDDIALVEPTSKKGKESKLFAIPVVHIFNKPEDTNRGRRAWENYMRKRRKEHKNGKK